MAVLDGASVSEVAGEIRGSRQSVHAWVRRYRDAGLAGLADRSHRAMSCPHRASAELEGGGLRTAPRASEVGRAADPARADARPGAAGAVAVALDREPHPRPPWPGRGP